MSKLVIFLFVLECTFLSATKLMAQETNIYLDLGIKKFIGSISTLDRSKYFGIQSSISSNELIDESSLLFDDLRIYKSVDFDGPEPFGNLEGLSNSKITQLAKEHQQTVVKNSKNRGSSFLVTQEPLKVFKLNSNYEDAAQRITTFLKGAYYPETNFFYTLMSNPFENTRLFSKESLSTRNKISLFYKTVISKVKKELPYVKIGGFDGTRPRFELNDFDYWKNTHRLFIDNVGSNIDFLSMELYDEVDKDTNTINYCSGSNSEATFDLIDTYNYSKFGKTIPHLITKYGLKYQDWIGTQYDPTHDGFIIESLNNFVMSFIDKPNRIVKAIPYIVGRANYFYEDAVNNPKGNPYPWAISRKNKDGTYTYTNLVKFYEFWKGVGGERTYISSENPDIQVNAFYKEGKWYTVYNNLSDTEQILNLKFSDFDINRISKYTLRRLFVDQEGVPELTEAFTDIHIDQLEISANETFMLICDVPADAQFATSIVEYNNYSKDYLKSIVSEKPISFNFANVVTGKGKANIRLSIGRNRNLSLLPKVELNGNIVLTPENWAGYDQSNKVDFFGTLIIPVPMSYLKEKNKIDITFYDTGGKVSSVVINTEIFSKDVENKNYIEKNSPVFVSHGGNLLNVSDKIECKNPKITDSKGSTIKKLKDYNSGDTIDISTLNSGEYFLEVSNGSKYKFKK